MSLDRPGREMANRATIIDPDVFKEAWIDTGCALNLFNEDVWNLAANPRELP